MIPQFITFINQSGIYDIILQVSDSIGCLKEVGQRVNWFPVPAFELNDSIFQGCSPFEVNIQNHSFPIENYAHLWDFGDGYYSSEINPRHIYQESGVYDVKYSTVSPSGCYGEHLFSNLVEVKESPKADFAFSPEIPTNFNSTVQFFNQSSYSDNWAWDFGYGNIVNEQHTSFTFSDTGTFQVSLIASNAFYCTDTIKKVIDIIPSFTYYLPNAFTPNGDGNK